MRTAFAGLALHRGRLARTGDHVLAAGGRAKCRAIRQSRGNRILPTSARPSRDLAALRLAQVVPLSAIHGVGSQAVEACAARVEALADRLADWPGALAARKVVWHTCLMRQPVPRALALGHELLSLAERSGDPAH